MSFDNWNRLVESVKNTENEHGANTECATSKFEESEQITTITNVDSKKASQK